MSSSMKFDLSPLPFDLNGLEPYISKKTLELHYGYHFRYARDLNNLLTGTKFKNLEIETIIKIADGPLFNTAAQVWNHSFYFDSLTPGVNKLKGVLADVIKNNFGSISFFKNSFFKAAESLFGAGWVWLVLNQKDSLEIVQRSNAGNPIRSGLIPLLNCDMWEHAYYLDYNNRRRNYLEAYWKLINWEIIEKRYNDAVQQQKGDIIQNRKVNKTIQNLTNHERLH
jgi:Fe-Mn family superoxide dismutase